MQQNPGEGITPRYCPVCLLGFFADSEVNEHTLPGSTIDMNIVKGEIPVSNLVFTQMFAHLPGILNKIDQLIAR